MSVASSGSRKFPGRNDERDMGAWEMVAHELAKQAGLEMAEARIEDFGGRQHTYLVRRFDRTPGTQGKERIHFASAMTLLGYNDGADHTEGVSYLELVELLIRHGAEPDRDLHELWRRIVFSIAIRNTDDHLRNHGFLLTPGGWRLSPAFDLNPNPDGYGLNLNISETDSGAGAKSCRTCTICIMFLHYYTSTRSHSPFHLSPSFTRARSGMAEAGE